ncbi:M42 family metallopeptidase [Agathobaculum sp.]|uniref:M42 family metallopeptidase n=1 Tax=Agathobaculum sp. TaxID=2048138 RepID=UPI002A802A49|nr:M20/M25/M40 family metallo-hydrolase [Agathobaculum sp.]MDY3618979.1 M20/M25/M40 family metallo-hydrolase [Agathobaculum sp.]
MIELLKTLCALPGPSGCEEMVRAWISKEVEPYADEMRTDAIGNLMAFRKGERALERPVVLAAHMDEVGVIIKKITDEGMLKFGFVGGVDPRVVIGRCIRFGEVTGVVGIKAVHLSTAAERKTMPKTGDLYIDIGADNKQSAEARVAPGDYGVFDSACVRFGDGMLKAKAIDDRLGCAVLLSLLREKPPVDTWFCFTVQEETGLRGAATMAYALDPGFCLIIEGTTAADLYEISDGKAVCRVRGGAVIPFMDGATIYDAELFDLLRRACEKRGIPWQTKSRVSGGTDAGRIQKARAGVRVCAVAAPVRYIHSPAGVAAESDMIAVRDAARAFLEEIGGDGDE